MITHEEFAEVYRQVARAKECQQRTASAESGQDVRDAWEDFLGAFGRAIGKMISLGKLHPETRPWSNRLHNLSTKDDLGLLYFREARNSVEHGLKPVADVREPRAQVGPFFEGTNGHVAISGSSINGVPCNGFARIVDGKVVAAQGNIPIRELPTEVKLNTVHNPDKKITVDVPRKIYDHVLRRRLHLTDPCHDAGDVYEGFE